MSWADREINGLFFRNEQSLCEQENTLSYSNNVDLPDLYFGDKYTFQWFSVIRVAHLVWYVWHILCDPCGTYCVIRVAHLVWYVWHII
jgi:hypothetical protein